MTRALPTTGSTRTTIKGLPGLSAADEERLRAQAQAHIQKLKDEGKWTAGVKAHSEYQGRTLDWIVEKLGVPRNTLVWSENPGYATHKWDGDRDPLVKMCRALDDWNDCGVESATGTGKTFTAACVVLSFLAIWEDSLVVTGAPKSDQLLLQIWKEIGALWPKFSTLFPQAELLTGKIRMKPDEDGKETWAAVAFVAGVGADEDAAAKAQGFHRRHMLFVTEETPGMHPPIMVAFEHTRTDDHNLHLALGNPDHRNDPLHRFCFDEHEKQRPGVVHVRISALDHPNIVTGAPIVPGAIGKRALERRIAKNPPGSRLYESRIRGISPAEAEDALIKWEWCVAAAERYKDNKFREGLLALGVDVSDAPEGDPAAIARWQGACCTEVESWQVKDATEVGEKVFLEASSKDHPIDPRYIGVDDVGVGAAAVNELARRGMKVRRIGGKRKAIPGLDEDTFWSETQVVEGRVRPKGPKVIEAERFANERSQVEWRMREDLRLGLVALPFDTELFTDLCTPSYTTKNGVIEVESKESIIARLGRSPNKGNACAYGNWVRRRGPAKRHVPEPPQSKNTDTGLERLVARHEKRRKIEEQRFERALKERARMKRRGGR